MLDNLGTTVQIVRGSPKAVSSANFYRENGFQLIDTESPIGEEAILLTDGTIHLLLVNDTNNYLALAYFDKDHSSRVKILEDLGITYRQSSDGKITTFHLIEGALMVKLVEDTFEYPHSDLSLTGMGKFGEFAIPVNNYQTTANFIKTLGFNELFASTESYPWGIFSDNNIVLGIHQTNNFDSPGLTYFHKDMDQIIGNLQGKGITLHQFGDYEISAGVARLVAPDGLNLFLIKGVV